MGEDMIINMVLHTRIRPEFSSLFVKSDDKVIFEYYGQTDDLVEKYAFLYRFLDDIAEANIILKEVETE